MSARGASAALLVGFVLLVSGCGPPGAVGESESGYFIRMPERAGSPSSESNSGGTIVMTTNLPEGTLVSFEGRPIGTQSGATRSSSCCPAVKDGMLTYAMHGGTCGLSPDGVEATGFSVRVVVTPDPSRGQTCGAFCTFSDEQPQSVQAELGPNFENLEGEQVTTVDGMRALVATGEFEWPPDACDAVVAYAMPETCGASTISINDDEGGENIKAVAGSLIGVLSQLRLCDLYNYATDDFQKANPWPEFRDRMKAWWDAHMPLAGPNYDFYLSQKIVRRAGRTIGGEFDSPEWIEVDYFMHGEKVGYARYVAKLWYSGYTKWDMAELSLLD